MPAGRRGHTSAEIWGRTLHHTRGWTIALAAIRGRIAREPDVDGPVAFLTCGMFAMSRRFWPVVAGAMAAGVLVISVRTSWTGSPAHLVIARNAGPLFETLGNDSRVAGWNVGIASWKTGGRVMNLDGLGNDQVVQPIQTGSLACYLAAMQVSHLMDFGFMFPGQIDTAFSSDEEARRLLHLQRNGYDSRKLYRCLEVSAAARDEAFTLSTYRLFAVDQNCVAALCPHAR